MKYLKIRDMYILMTGVIQIEVLKGMLRIVYENGKQKDILYRDHFGGEVEDIRAEIIAALDTYNETL